MNSPTPETLERMHQIRNDLRELYEKHDLHSIAVTFAFNHGAEGSIYMNGCRASIEQGVDVLASALGLFENDDFEMETLPEAPKQRFH